MKFVKSIFTVCSYRVYLHFDHHLTTTVQAAPQNVGKARCDNQQRAFSCFGGKCAEPTKFTFHRQSIPLCRSSPTRKARGSNPPGRTKSSTLWGVALFVLHGFYGAVKSGIQTARAPRFASRGAETPRWGVSRARLGESLPVAQKSALQCTLRSKAVIVGLILNTRQETISVSHIVMFAEKTYNAFEPAGHTKRGKERKS